MKEMARLSIVANVGLCCVLFALCFRGLTQATVSDEQNALKFKWYDNVTAEKVEAEHNPDPTKHLVEFTDLFSEINGTFLLGGTNFTSEFPDSISWRKSSGFVDTVFYSYQKHHNLIIRPDDVWTAIIIQLSLYVNANADALRHLFVNFERKRNLVVDFVAPVDEIPINEFIDNIVVLINANIASNIVDWVVPNFTTTTANDKLTAGAALMATVQKYFDYGLVAILCGIPEVTILGDVNDWRQIRQRIDKLREFELDGQNVMAKWSSMLGRILDEFIKVKEGQTKDDEFWKQAIRVDYKTIDLICAEETEIHLNGWITAFCAFDKSGKWQKETEIVSTNAEQLSGKTQWLSVRTDDITPGIVDVPIKIYDQYAKPEEREYTGAIITGFMGHAVKKDGITLQPLSGWAMTITNKPPEYLEYSNLI